MKKIRIIGNGTVYFSNRSKKWRGEIKWEDQCGAIHRNTFSGDDELDVRVQMRQFEKNVNNLASDLYKTRFSDYANEWLENVLSLKLKPSSLMRKDFTLKNQVFPYIGNMFIEDITHRDIQNMVSSLSKDGLSFSTIKKAYEAVSGCCKYFRLDHNEYINPCEGVTLPAQDAEEMRAFTEQERQMIEDECLRRYKNGRLVYRLGPAFILLMYSGMRVGELIALTWKDVDFSKRLIRINKNAVTVKQDGKYVQINQKSTKTKSGMRTVPITQKAFEALEMLKTISKGEYVLMTSSDKQSTHCYLNRAFHKVLKNCGITTFDETYGVHTLRHTFASMLFQNGCDVKIVSSILGHSSVRITYDIYVSVIQEQKIKAIENIDRFCC